MVFETFRCNDGVEIKHFTKKFQKNHASLLPKDFPIFSMSMTNKKPKKAVPSAVKNSAPDLAFSVVQILPQHLHKC